MTDRFDRITLFLLSPLLFTLAVGLVHRLAAWMRNDKEKS